MAAQALLIASAIISAYAAAKQGSDARKAADKQAAVERQQAQRERLEAAANEDQFRRDQERLMGRRRAQMGASGVRLDTGSPLLTDEDFASEAEFQALRIRSGGELLSTRLEQQADLTQFKGRADQRQGYYRAGGSLLKAAGKRWGRE